VRRAVHTLVTVLALLSASAPAGAGAPAPTEAVGVPDATITISGNVIALGVGYEWARGTLTYKGQTIPFWVRGISAMDIGVAKFTGVGEVFHLDSLSEFAGNYVGSTFGSAVPHGESIVLLKNEKAVSIRARSTVSGIRLNFSGNGMRIRLSAPSKREIAPDAAALSP
jgi:outer membrane immunogenic protein